MEQRLRSVGILGPVKEGAVILSLLYQYTAVHRLGLDATTGAAEEPHISAGSTLTLALPKTGLDVEPVGRLVLADIGIPSDTYRRSGLRVYPRALGSEFIVSLEAS